MAENRQRRISTDEDFMKYSTDDLLYGAMYYLSTYHKTYQKLYLTKKNYTKSRKELYAICGLNAQSLNNHLNKLIDNGLIEKDVMKVGEEDVEVYTFPYNKNGKYELVENEMLWYIVSTRNKQAVRVYVYLLSKYLWKQKTGDEFIFTNKDILKALGYSPDYKLASSMITNILESFQREGVINYEEEYEAHIMNDGNITPTPKKRLYFVARSKSELK